MGMIRLSSVSVPLHAAGHEAGIAAEILRVKAERIQACRVIRRAVDARNKENVHLVMTLDVQVEGDEEAVLRSARYAQAAISRDAAVYAAPPSVSKPRRRPVVVGGGPAGLFAALTLAKAGAEPILLERGPEAEARRRAVEAFWSGGPLHEDANVQFGEGGAGTFSDGKLTTGIRDPRCAEVLRAFVRCGAPEEILWQAKPHMGTDHLLHVAQGLRREIEALGGAVRFGARMTGINAEGGAVRGVWLGQEELEADAVVLAIGHSARDTFEMLQRLGVRMEQKPFSIGARIEHPQALIDRAQYGRSAGHPALGAAEYKLSCHLPNGRGVYTFCMCPGGEVVAAASETGRVVTNGMSLFARDGQNANSALLVDVRPEDFASDDPLAGMHFQRGWERKAYLAGGGDYRAPAQRAEDFLAGRASKAVDAGRPTYRPGVTPADLGACLPAFAVESMREALRLFDGRVKGFASPDAVLTGVETRSSCPVRIVRDATGQASVAGLFPAGEGAGYAGGIMSAAVDGMRAAEKVISQMAGGNL